MGRVRPSTIFFRTGPGSLWLRGRPYLLKGGLWLLFIIAIGLRFGHFASPYRLAYENDIEAHMIYIHYVRDHWAFPPVNDSFEYPQEPLYYALAATLYNPTFDEAANQTGIAAFGLMISLGGLCLLFLSLRYLSSWLVRYGLLIFMGLTPAFVLRSDCVGNDSLVAFFGIFYFFCLQRLNRNPDKIRHFWWAVTAFMLELFTKISGLVLVVSLPWLFWRSARGPFPYKKMLARAGLVGALTVVWLGLLLQRAWVPEERSFVFVKWAPFESQVIDGNFFEYAVYFNLPNLIAAGQTSIYSSKVRQFHSTVDKVRYSYPTWVFGNMLIGDWDYNINPRLLDAARCVIIFGTIFPFGFILFAAVALLGRPDTHSAGFFSLNKTALALVVGMAGLSLYYTLTRPTICCADYRLQAVTFAWAGWGFCRGWTAFPRGWALRTLAIVFLAGYTVSCLVLYYILEHTPNIPGTFW